MSGAHQAGETYRFPIRVYYEDTDAAGVVYYANYLKFMERARTEWLASLGFEVADLERRYGIVFVVHRLEIDYRRPARLGERLDATLRMAELHRARLIVLQDLRRGVEVLTHARVTLACLDRADWRPARIPAAVIATLEGCR